MKLKCLNGPEGDEWDHECLPQLFNLLIEAIISSESMVTAVGNSFEFEKDGKVLYVSLKVAKTYEDLD